MQRYEKNDAPDCKKKINMNRDVDMLLNNCSYIWLIQFNIVILMIDLVFI